MSKATREQILSTLNHGWGTLIENYDHLTPDQQSAFLKSQGYARFADLLAHVIAWWEDAMRTIRKQVEAPDFQTPNIEVDRFNAEAVKRFQNQDEAALIHSFQAMRVGMVGLVFELSDESFADPRINERLRVEVLGHLSEHAIQA